MRSSHQAARAVLWGLARRSQAPLFGPALRHRSTPNANVAYTSNQGTWTGFGARRYAGLQGFMGGRLRLNRTALWAAVCLVLAGAAGFGFLAYRPALAPVARPDPASFDKAPVERGRVLANYGDCTACHTRPDGPA